MRILDPSMRESGADSHGGPGFHWPRPGDEGCRDGVLLQTGRSFRVVGTRSAESGPRRPVPAVGDERPQSADWSAIDARLR